MNLVSKATFLATHAPDEEQVPLPELGDGAAILVRGLTVRERSEFERQFLSKKGDRLDNRVKELRERLLIACCRNADGSMMFTVDDLKAIGNMSASIVERIVNVAQRLSGMSATDVDEIAKNSEQTQGD